MYIGHLYMESFIWKQISATPGLSICFPSSATTRLRPVFLISGLSVLGICSKTLWLRTVTSAPVSMMAEIGFPEICMGALMDTALTFWTNTWLEYESGLFACSGKSVLGVVMSSSLGLDCWSESNCWAGITWGKHMSFCSSLSFRGLMSAVWAAQVFKPMLNNSSCLPSEVRSGGAGPSSAKCAEHSVLDSHCDALYCPPQYNMHGGSCPDKHIAATGTFWSQSDMASAPPWAQGAWTSLTAILPRSAQN